MCFVPSLGLAAAMSLAWLLIFRTDASAADEFVIDIPAGTADAISRGATPPSLPTSLRLSAATRLLVRNSDSVPHQLGSLTVPAGTEQNAPASVFLSASSNRFLCSFHPIGSIGLSLYKDSSPLLAVWWSLIIGIPLGSVFFGITTVVSRFQEV